MKDSLSDKNQVIITFPDGCEHEGMKRKRKGGKIQRHGRGLRIAEEKDRQGELGEECWVGNKARNRGAEEK